MPVVTDAKRVRPVRERRVLTTMGATLALVAPPLLPTLMPNRSIRVAGYTVAAEFQDEAHHSAEGPAGAESFRERGTFAYHLWIGRTCYRSVWLSPDGNTKWLL